MKAVVYSLSKSRHKECSRENEHLFIMVDIPFIPNKGMSIKVTKSGELLTIDQLLWDCDKPDAIIIFTKDEALNLLPSFGEMLGQGWQVASVGNLEEKAAA
ncbi:MAG: hypothetical protein ACYC0M_10385 [Burkholderiales bacterium]